MTLLIAFAVLSILVSFICSILEAALLSLTPSFIAHQKTTRPKLYERLKELKDKVDQPLAAILTLNTVATLSAPPESAPRSPWSSATATLVSPRLS
ncbi:CNNM domain-containing protein [Stutzerimonas sp. R40042]|nr:CNNM domain-containing protein [Stutzerimonas sp. R40042]